MKKTFRVEIINSYQASMFILTHRTLQQVISIIEGFEGEELTFNIQDQKTLKKHDISEFIIKPLWVNTGKGA